VTLHRQTSLHHHLKLYCGPQFATEYKETSFIKEYHAIASKIHKIKKDM
jgi:hypothetical protein